MNADILKVPPYLRGNIERAERLINAYDMHDEDAAALRKMVADLVRQVDGNDQKYQKALGQLDALRRSSAPAHVAPVRQFGGDWDSDDSDERPRRLSTHERHQGLADRGVDTWEDYRGER